MQKKGIVMQIKDGQAILMTPEGQFLRVPLSDGMAIGQEVEVKEVVQPATKRAERSWFRGRWQQTGIVAATLLLAVGFWSSQSSMFVSETASAYVTVDINPSVELTINEDRDVIGLTALNDDGKQVLADLKLIGESVEEAVAAFTEAAREGGFLQDNAEIVITASDADTEEAAQDSLELDDLEGQLVGTVQDSASRHNVQVTVESLQVSKELRNASHDVGLSPGKYALYLMAQSNGIEVTVDELKTQPISKIVEKRGTELADVLHDLKGKEQLDDLLDTLKKEGEVGLKKKGKSTTPPGQEKKQEPAENGKTDDKKQDPSNPGSNNQDKEQKKDDKQPPGQDKKDEKQGKTDDKSPASPAPADGKQTQTPTQTPKQDDKGGERGRSDDGKSKQDDHPKSGDSTHKNSKDTSKEDDKKGKGRD